MLNCADPTQNMYSWQVWQRNIIGVNVTEYRGSILSCRDDQIIIFHMPRIRIRVKINFFLHFYKIHWRISSVFFVPGVYHCSTMDGRLLSKALLCVWLLFECVNGLWITITALFSITDKVAHCTHLTSFLLLCLH